MVTFDLVEKEYRLLKLENINGISDYEDLRFMMNDILIVVDENNDKWRINPDSDRWQWYDAKKDEWLERERPGKKDRKDEDYTVAIKPPAPPKIPQESLKKDIKTCVYCPSCKEEVKPSAKFCKSCGYNLEKPVKGKCASCGQLNKETAKFCRNCGDSLQ